MADDKKKDADPKADAGAKKKKGMPTIVMVAVGAIVGGAGVVFAVPPKTVTVEAPPKVLEPVIVEHPDLITHRFNPKVRTGKGLASISFRFEYRVVDKEHKEHAFEQIKAKWNKANGLVLELLTTRTIDELQNQKAILRKELMDLLDQTFFPAEGGHKFASIEDLYWGECIFQ